MVNLNNPRYAEYANDPVGCGLRLFSIFGKINTLIVDGAAVPNYLVNLTLGKAAKGIIKVGSYSIVRIDGRCVLRITSE